MDTRNQTYEQVIVASKRAREPTPEGYRRIDVTSRATDICFGAGYEEKQRVATGVPK